MLTRPQMRTAGLGAEQARRQLKGHAEHVIVGKKVFAGPAARVRSSLEAGEVLAALVVEHVHDAHEVDEESVAAQSEEAGVGARGVDVRLGTERHLDVFEDRLAGGLSLTGLGAGCQVNGGPLPAAFRLGEHQDEGDIGLGVTVVVDIDPVHGLGVELRFLGEGVTVEDDHGPRGVRRCLEGVEIGEVESSVTFGRAEFQAGEVVRHAVLLTITSSMSIIYRKK